MSYDETYKKTKNNFGAGPEPILRDYYHRISKSMPVADIGAGQGRNAFFLARQGFMVEAIEPSKEATNTISTVAMQEGLSIHSHQCDFEEFVSQVDFYSGILIFGLIQILSWQDISLLLEKVKHWTNTGSLIFVTGFTVGDSSFTRYSQTWKTIGKNSFTDGQGSFRTYLEAGEILDLFSEYEVVHHWEGVGLEHRHGNGPIERHAMTEVVLQR